MHRLFLCTSITFLIAATLCAVGCKKDPQAPQTTLPPEYIGTFRCEIGSPGGSFYMLQVLETRADGTATFSSQHQDPGDSNAGVKKVANGKWTVNDKTVTVTLEFSAAGEPIPEHDSTLRLIASADGSQMVFDARGGAILRRDVPATKPAP